MVCFMYEPLCVVVRLFSIHNKRVLNSSVPTVVIVNPHIIQPIQEKIHDIVKKLIKPTMTIKTNSKRHST